MSSSPHPSPQHVPPPSSLHANRSLSSESSWTSESIHDNPVASEFTVSPMMNSTAAAPVILHDPTKHPQNATNIPPIASNPGNAKIDNSTKIRAPAPSPTTPQFSLP